MRKIDVEIVFVVLVYRNIDDLQNFIINTKSKVKCNYKIIVIDAKYSDEVSKDIENICFQNKLVYIQIDNKGYGFCNLLLLAIIWGAIIISESHKFSILNVLINSTSGLQIIIYLYSYILFAYSIPTLFPYPYPLFSK